MKHPIYLIAIGLLACALLGTGAQARTWYVPSEVATLTGALDLAQPGDTIELAVGIHRIAGDGHRIPAGVTITTDTGMPGGVVLVEEPAYFGDWRNQPVFVVNTTLGPANEVALRGITFQDFTNTFGPNEFIGQPIIGVLHGRLILENCDFRDYVGTAVKFAGGSGEFSQCSFVHGHGQPAALEFDGDALALNGCTFIACSARFPGDVVNPNVRGPEASIVKLLGGETTCDNSVFENNGPVTYVVDVGAEARLLACETCLSSNPPIWQGRVAGYVQMTCCTVVPTLWRIVDGGTLIVLDNGSPPRAVATEGTSLSLLRSLFD
jgi:hypothetical protein